MGKIKDAASDWLMDIGYNLGYDWDSLPDSSQWENIKTKRIYRRMYGKRKNNPDTW